MYDDKCFERFSHLCYLGTSRYYNSLFQYVTQCTLVHHRSGGDWNKNGIFSVSPSRRKSCIYSTRPRHSISRRLLKTRIECPTLASQSNCEWSKMETAISWAKPSILLRSRPLKLTFNLPGQGWVLQSRDRSFSPLHSSPPLVGGGLVHVRELVCDPPPQDFVHGPHGFHPLHFPSTEKKLILFLTWNFATVTNCIKFFFVRRCFYIFVSTQHL